MKKLYLVGLFAMIFLASSLLGALVSGHMLQSAMAVRIDGSPYELQLQLRNGTPIVSYDWGQFLEGQAKLLACQLVNRGNARAKVTWNTTGFPSGWEIGIWTELERKSKLWRQGTTITISPERIGNIEIYLREVNGEPDQSESFTLNFIAFGKTKKPH